MLLSARFASVLWITVPQSSPQGIISVFQEVVCEALACVRCQDLRSDPYEEGLSRRRRHQTVEAEGLVSRSLYRAGTCSAASTRESPTGNCGREGFAVRTYSRGPETCPGRRLERRAFTRVVCSFSGGGGQ